MLFFAFSYRIFTLCLIVLNQCLLSGIQIVQQIITPTGEIHQIPIQLNAQQLQVENVPVGDHPYLLLSSQGDQSPDDGGSRLLTAHCHPNCPNSGSNCSACSGKQNFYRIQLNVTRKTIWFRKLLIFPISS